MSATQADELRHVHHLTPRRKASNLNASSSLHSAAAIRDAPLPDAGENKTHVAVTPSPPSAAAAKDSFLNDKDSSSDSDSDSSSSSSEGHQDNKIDRRALTSELHAAGVDTSGLSDYELLRLRNIKRNEAKLRSLGLFKGITSKPKGSDGDKYKSERVKKAAETRRKNKKLAREKVEQHNREQEEWRRKKYGDATTADDDADGSERVQPHRNAKSVTTYSAKAAVPSKRRVQWENNLSSLRSFHKQFGTFQITAQHGSEYKSLQQWKHRQRKEYFLFKEGKKSVLDKEQVSLLEQLGGDWLVSGRGRGRSFATVAMRKRTTRQSSRNLWADYSDDEDYEEEEEMMAKWAAEETEDEEDKGDVVIGSSDSFSVISEESEVDDSKRQMNMRRGYHSEASKRKYESRSNLNRRHYSESEESGDESEDESFQSLSQQRHHSTITSRKSHHRIGHKRKTERRVGFVGKKRKYRDSSPPAKRSKRRLVSSLEVAAPVEIESSMSSPSLKRSRSYAGDYKTPHRTYSLREEESLVSAEEASYQAGSSRRRRKRYVHQRSSRHHEGYEVVEKPMDEIVVRDIDLQAERDKLMAEYGALYGRQCVILAKKDQLEKELRGMEFARKLLVDTASSSMSDCTNQK